MELISREEALKVFKYGRTRATAYRTSIENLPTIESRPKGKWIKGDMFECDQCHHRMIVGDGAYNYCPNCGADMRGEE